MPRRPKLRTVKLSRGRVITVRSGLEEALALQIDRAGVPVEYEEDILKYNKPQRLSRYTPDFRLPNGIRVEGKGLFTSADRVKHLLIKEQWPDEDIRFVFSRSSQVLRKGSNTTYADWCVKHGFRYADKVIPTSWFKEVKHGSR
jgi:Phage endonuclease I